MIALKKRGIARTALFVAGFLALATTAFSEDIAPRSGGETQSTREEPAKADDPTDVPAARTLTVEEAVALAMESNMQLESSAIDLRIKERARDNAWNVFIPSAQVSGTLARQNKASNPYAAIFQSMGIPVSSPTEKDHWSTVAGLSLGLNLNAALVEGLRATRQSYEAGKLSHDQAMEQTDRDVRKAFYAILLQEESVRLLREKLATGEDRLKQTEINYRNGVLPELSVLQAQLSVETQKPALREAEIALERQKALFAFIIGLPPNTAITLVGKVAPAIRSYDGDELVKTRLAERLDVAILSKNLELANTQIRAARLQAYTPSVALGQSWLPMKAPIDADKWTDSQGAFTVTVTFDLVGLFPFSRTGQSLEDARESARKLEISLSQTAYNAELEIRDLVKRLDKARSSIATMELSVAIAQKAYRLSEQGYRAGTIEYLDLKDAENSLLQAELGVLMEKYNYLSTLLDLETAVNARLD
jgi:outer membrane protein TolC